MNPRVAIRYRTKLGSVLRPPNGAETLGNGWFTYPSWRFYEGAIEAMIAADVPYRDVKQLPEWES